MATLIDVDGREIAVRDVDPEVGVSVRRDRQGETGGTVHHWITLRDGTRREVGWEQQLRLLKLWGLAPDYA